MALREFRKAKGNLGYFEAVRRSKDPPTFIVLFEDSAALIGLAIAALGTFAAERLAMPELDGAASVGIALLLGLTALALARESKGLLIGEPASRELREAILRHRAKMPGIERAQIVFTVHLAPDQVIVALNLEFRDDLTTPEIEEATTEIERAVHAEHPEVIAIFVKPETATATHHFSRMGGAARIAFNELVVDDAEAEIRRSAQHQRVAARAPARHQRERGQRFQVGLQARARALAVDHVLRQRLGQRPRLDADRAGAELDPPAHGLAPQADGGLAVLCYRQDRHALDRPHRRHIELQIWSNGKGWAAAAAAARREAASGQHAAEKALRPADRREFMPFGSGSGGRGRAAREHKHMKARPAPSSGPVE